MNQREKDIDAAPDRQRPLYKEGWADGAEYARRELFERLRAEIDQLPVGPLTLEDLNAVAKEYGL